MEPPVRAMQSTIDAPRQLYRPRDEVLRFVMGHVERSLQGHGPSGKADLPGLETRIMHLERHPCKGKSNVNSSTTHLLTLPTMDRGHCKELQGILQLL